MTHPTHLIALAFTAALWTGTAQAQSQWTEPGPLDFWQEGPWPGLGDPTMNPPGSDWATEPTPHTSFEWADEGDVTRGFQPSVEIAPRPTFQTDSQSAFQSDVGAPMDAIGILDWADSTPAAPMDNSTPETIWGGATYGNTQAPASAIVADDPIVVSPLPDAGQAAQPLPEPNQAAQPLPKPSNGPVPLPGSRDDAAFDVARIDALLNGIAVDPPAPLAQDCAAWASVTQASSSSASVLIEIACLANETVYLQLGDNAPETVALDAYGAAQRVLGTSGAIHPMTLRRTHDGALLSQQDTPDQPPTVYAP